MSTNRFQVKQNNQPITKAHNSIQELSYVTEESNRQLTNQLISDSIIELTYVTEQSNEQLTDQHSEIDSTLKVGNLINTINTHQNYKTNRRLNS